MFQHLKITKTDAQLNFDLELEPNKRAYIFIGENGCGKTVLLESLGQIFLYSHAIWREEASGPTPFRQVRSKIKFRDALADKWLRVPDAELDGQPLKPSPGWGMSKLVPEGGKPLLLTSATVTRPVCYVSALQRAELASSKDQSIRLAGSSLDSFIEAMHNLLADLARERRSAQSITSWLMSHIMINPNFIPDGIKNLDLLQALLLLELLTEFDPDTFQGLLQSEGGHAQLHLGLLYQEGELLFLGRPIHKLAQGWIALLKIFQEIVASIAAWEGMRGSNAIEDSDAIILIDELDAHLHPRWQTRLIPFLKKSFPNATFFISTHSPLIVRDTEPGEVYELKKEGQQVTTQRVGSPRDWFLTDLYEHAFHVEIPAPGTEGTPPFVTLMRQYVETVRAVTTKASPERRAEAIAQYEELSGRLPSDDPRRSTIEQLRRMLG